jgi:hypothetical protein
MNEHTTCYYLVDGIYIEWIAFMKTTTFSSILRNISCFPNTKKGQGKMWIIFLGYYSPGLSLFAGLQDFGREKVLEGSC